MATKRRLETLRELLPRAEQAGYAVGAFSPRYTGMISPVVRAAQALSSPLIVQISQKELTRSQITPRQFASTFFRVIEEENLTVPVVLHLDHTRQFPLIQEAIEAGFTSVMIDASDKNLEENIAITREVVEFAHQHGVSVEAELGRIFSADQIETDDQEASYTLPDEAQYFVLQTQVDALAVSVGTVHGVYRSRTPTIELERLRQIRAMTSVHLVLHGGSGLPVSVLQSAIHLPGGGVSKVNFATDLELAALKALGRETPLTDSEMSSLSVNDLTRAQQAV